MSVRLSCFSALFFVGCGNEPITADLLDPDWKNDAGWPVASTGDTTPSTITDPSGTVGELTASLSDDDCIVTWSVDGDRTSCSDCEFAFDILMEVVEDTCGMGSTFRGTLEIGHGAVYFLDTRLASYERIGNAIVFDSREDGSDSTEPYDYYDDYYYGPSSVAYYGTLNLLAP
jgi:hypothetical protein